MAQKQKKSGKKSGASDVCIILTDRVLFIEMKKNKKKLKNGKFSKAGISVADSQIEFLDTVSLSNAVDGAVCYGTEDAINYVKKYV
jgi:hypothetical protein